MAILPKPTIIYHADWGSHDSKRWYAKATLGANECYTALAPQQVGNPEETVWRIVASLGR